MNFQDSMGKYRLIVDGLLREYLERKIKECGGSTISVNYRFIRDFVLNGGKRLRPVALIMAYKAVSRDNEDSILIPSLSVELMHNSTLVHDDIMDEDELRRGKPTLFIKSREHFLENHKEKKYNGALFGKASSKAAAGNAILNGNILLSLAFDALMHSRNRDSGNALNVLNNAYKTVAEGQMMDLLTESSNTISEKEYLEMISKKTAELFKASVQIGALLGNGSFTQAEHMANYAFEAAMAFQIHDDIMDISPEMDKGHEIGSDIRQGKKNILIIKALEFSGSLQRKAIINALGNKNASREKTGLAIETIKSSGAVEYAKQLALARIMLAKGHLGKAGISAGAFEFFSSLADYMVERKL